ncbi:MAG: hypothetical protein IJS05_02030, partial [Paludibacteraceae bacterium]|nr:hypothetical protein [Paludibacteraceae bacterium]
MKRWNGSAWVKVGSYDYYNATLTKDNPYTIGTAGANFVAGFYQWYVKMTYGGTVFTSETVQNAIYQPYQVTIIIEENARSGDKAWFTGLYAYREDNLDKVPASANSTYPGQPREDCCTEVADYTYIYTFKYPVYTHLRLNDNSSSTVNRTEAIAITGNTCITLSGERFRNYDNWAYSTESCSNTYYRVKSVNDAFTYYSNAVQNNGDSLSFFAGPSSQLTVEKLENGIWKQTGSEISAARKPATGGIYYAIFNSSTGYLNSIGTGSETYMKAYNGALFIRTDMAAGGWENYINNDNKFIHFDDVNSTYNNYWVRYSGDGRSVNIDAEIGNRINRCLSRHLKDRGRLADADGKVTQRNVRYSYDTRSGYFDYAVLGESTNTSYVFLSTYGADAAGDDGSNKVFKWVYNKTKDEYEKGDATRENNPTYQAKFEDLSDWRYQADVYAHADGTNNVTIGVQARLPEGLPQDLVKKETPLEALGASTTEGNYIIRIIYDFKTNTIVTGWLPGEINADKRENITADKEIAGNMILNRVEAGSTPQINITGSSKLTGLKRLYMALEIQRDNASGEYQKVRKGVSKITSNATEGDKETNLYYWISLPYDCNIEDIFGLQGSYGYMWGIFRYRGDERAQKGLFIDSGTYWELLPQNGTLKAGEGYALAIDLHYSDFNEIKIDDVTRSSKYLYFPTPNNGYTLKNIDHSATDLPDYVCTISGREQFDTGWHVVGVPGFKDVSNPGVAGTVYTPTGQAQPAFYYEYVYNTKGDAGSSDNNAYRYHTATGDTYKVFHGY